jgi:CRP-like cAMP-binding protein
METIESIVLGQEFFAGLDPEIGKFIAGCARNHRFKEGTYLFREGEPAREFYLIRHGRVALEVSAPGRTTLVLATMREGELVGASWLVPPYRWNAAAHAQTHVRAIGFDAECLRAKCEQDQRTGYQLLKRFSPVVVKRLESAHVQLLDLYGRPERT